MHSRGELITELVWESGMFPTWLMLILRFSSTTSSIQKLPSKSPNFWSVDQLARTRSSVGRSFRSVSSPFMVSLDTRKPDSSNSGMGMKLASEPLSMAWKRRKNSSSSRALLAWSSACS